MLIESSAELGIVVRIEHVFTHFALTLSVWRAEAGGEAEGLIWSRRSDLDGMCAHRRNQRSGIGATEPS